MRLQRIAGCKRSEVLTALSLAMVVCWVVTTCGFVGGWKRLEETQYLHL